jgi:hypothetical protein
MMIAELERQAANDNRPRVKQRTRADEIYLTMCAGLGASVLFVAIMWVLALSALPPR